MLIIALSTLLAASLAADPAVGVVRGQVRSETTTLPIAYATVEVMTQDGGMPLLAVTDSVGIYLLQNVPAGRRLLRARHMDHAALEVEVLVPPDGEVLLDFALQIRPVLLPALLVRGDVPHPFLDTLPAPAPELGAAQLRVLEATPGMAELGLADAARGAGGREPTDPSDVLFVRGAAADLKLVLLDGAPVYAPFHLGGIIHTFQADILKAANIYLGGAPARYEGGLSYILDLETRAGRREGLHAAAAVDMVSGRALLEGPITQRAAFLIAGRAVDGAGASQLWNETFPYEYADALARFDVHAGEAGDIGVTGFWNREAVRLNAETEGYDLATWDNAAGSVRYRGEIAGAEAEITAAFGDFHARLPVGGQRPLLADGVTRRTRVTADFRSTPGPAEVQYGVSYDRLVLHYRAWHTGEEAAEPLLETRAAGDVAGAYVDAAWEPLARIRLRGGLRADIFSMERAPRLAPRIAATWMITERAALTVAGGAYRQYVRVPEPAVAAPARAENDIVEDPLVPLTVAHASHFVLALDQDLGETVRLGVQGHYKSFSGVPAEERTRADASGVDFWVRRSTGTFTGWLGYSLAWIWSLEGDRAITHLFSGRHLLSTGLSGPLGELGRFDVSFAYGAGLPYTAIPGESGKQAAAEPGTLARLTPETEGDSTRHNAGPTEPYLRLDAAVSRTFRPRWQGTTFQITPYVRVLNALDRRDAMFYHLDIVGEGEPRALASLPVLPIVGLEMKF